MGISCRRKGLGVKLSQWVGTDGDSVSNLLKSSFLGSIVPSVTGLDLSTL